MKTKRELDLLIDLAKLLKKYGPGSFESLAESISSPETAQKLSVVLVQVAKIGRTIPKTKRNIRHKKEPSIPKSLIILEKIEPQKYKFLMNFYNDLIVKKILPSLRDIKEFATDCGLPEIRAESRQKAIGPLISLLIKFSNEQLIAKIQSLKKHDTSDRSLEGWSDVILKKQRKSEENR